MRYICLVLLLVGQLSSAHLSSSTDGARKLKLSAASKAVDTEGFTRTSSGPITEPTAGIDEESPEQSEQPMPADEESDSGSSVVQSPAGDGTYYGSSEVDSGDKPDSTEESEEPIYPTLVSGYDATTKKDKDSDESASKEKKSEDTTAEKAEDPAAEKAEDPATEKAEDPADVEVRSILNFMPIIFSRGS